MKRARGIVIGALGLAALLAVWFIFTGGDSPVAHAPQKAAAAARTFARLAFIEQGYKEAFRALDDQARAGVTLEQFIDSVKQMHPHAFPVTVEPETYEPMFGRKAMTIFLTGVNGGETMYYRLELAGDDDSGYRVSGYFRGSGPYPHSVHRKAL